MASTAGRREPRPASLPTGDPAPGARARPRDPQRPREDPRRAVARERGGAGPQALGRAITGLAAGELTNHSRIRGLLAGRFLELDGLTAPSPLGPRELRGI